MEAFGSAKISGSTAAPRVTGPAHPVSSGSS